MEEWKVVEECPRYLINRLGQVKPIEGKRKDKIMKPSLGKRGYYAYNLETENGRLTRYLHRLLAIAFLPNPENKEEIDHIDRNRTNNSLDNLRWVNKQENMMNRTPGRSGELYITEQYRVKLPKYPSRYFATLEEAIQYRDSILNPVGNA